MCDIVQQEYGPLQSVDNPGMGNDQKVPLQMLETTIVAVQVHEAHLAAFGFRQALGFLGCLSHCADRSCVKLES